MASYIESKDCLFFFQKNFEIYFTGNARRLLRMWLPLYVGINARRFARPERKKVPGASQEFKKPLVLWLILFANFPSLPAPSGSL
jgi:hypothetical protein